MEPSGPIPFLAQDILIILLLIVANGLFSGAEIAIISARRYRLEQLSEKGDRSARVALRLAESPNQFLSTVQIGITLIGILTVRSVVPPLLASSIPCWNACLCWRPTAKG